MKYVWICFMLCVLVGVAEGQSTGPAAATPKNSETITGPVNGAFLALSVADVAVVSRWYTEKLGFRVISEGEALNKIAKFAPLQGDGTDIELIQHREANSRAVVALDLKGAHQIRGIFKLGFVVKNLDSVYKGLKQRDAASAYDLMPAKDVPMRSFSIRDIEGNLIQFFVQ